MANIHTFSQFQNSSNNNQKNIPYAPLGSSHSSQNRGNNNIISFGNYSTSSSDEGTPNDAPRPNIFNILFPGFSFKTFTFIISVVQVVVYLITTVISWTIKEEGGYNCLLFKFGGKYTPSVVVSHHIHRLILPVFLHANFMHIFFNLISQWLYGFQLEQNYGTKKFVFLYFFAGFGGNMLSAIKETETISVGASSALFGVFAFQMMYLIENYDKLGPRRNIMIILMAVLILANFGNGNQAKNVDNSSHIGGLITGGIVAVLYMKREEDPKFYQKKYIAIAVGVIYFIATSVMLATLQVKPGQPQGFKKFCDGILPF